MELCFNSPKENTLPLSRGLKEVAELEFLDYGTHLHAKSDAITKSGNIDGNKSERWLA